MSDMSAYQFYSEAARRDRQRAIFRIMLCFASLLVFQAKGKAAQAATPGPPGRQEVIGRLSGDDVSVNGAIGFETENGRTTALLASGSDLTLRSGEAKVDLPEGGDIILCGPAHLSILKSGPAITIALDYGQVHLQLGAAVQVTIYTPLLIVTPVVIGDRGRDLTVGLDQKGELCVMALSGAMRIEEQFTGASLIVPQGGDIQIEAGELRTLRNGSRTCSCELLVSHNLRCVLAGSSSAPESGSHADHPRIGGGPHDIFSGCCKPRFATAAGRSFQSRLAITPLEASLFREALGNISSP